MEETTVSQMAQVTPASEPPDLDDLIEAARWRPKFSHVGIPVDVSTKRRRLGQLLRRRREELGLTGMDVVRRIQVNQSTVGYAERGATMPHAALDRYLALLGWRVPEHPSGA